MEELNNILALQEQPQISEDDIKELEELADERQLEIELEQELEQYAIEQMLKDEGEE